MRRSARLGRALAIAWLIMLYPSVAAIFHAHPDGFRLTGILALLAVMSAIYVTYWVRFAGTADTRLVSGIVASLFALGILLNLLGGWTVNPFLLAIVIAGYGYRIPLAVAAVSGIIILCLALTVPTLAAAHLSGSDVVVVEIIAGIQLSIFGFGAVGASWLVSTVRQLHQAREQLALLAVEQERARFARDLHDLIGHSLSVITLKGELAQQLISSAPDQAASEVRDIVMVARQGLAEVRDAVSGYRQPTLANELAGARTALSAAGVECTVEQAGGALTPESEAVLGWTVREGVTNVLRHSRARRCSILLTRTDDAVQLDVVDDGPSQEVPKAGNGLRGLGERVREQRGRLEAGPLPHQGFRLRVTLPTGTEAELTPQSDAMRDIAE